MTPTRAIGSALLAAALFGASTPLAKLLLGDVAPVLLAGLFYAGSGIGLALVIVVRRSTAGANAARPEVPSRTDFKWLAAAIASGGVAGPVLLMIGLTSTTASVGSLLLNLESVFTAVLAWSLFRENFDRRIAAGMALIVMGGVMLAWAPGDSALTAGSLLIAAACLCWGIDNNLTRKVAANDAMTIACIKGSVAGMVNITIALALGNVFPAWPVVVAALVVGFVGYGISLTLFVVALRELGTARTGAYFSVAPFFGALLALAIQPDPLSSGFVVAALLMAGGVWLHVTERHSHDHDHPQSSHSHMHSHDEHHQHAHDTTENETEPHAHPHEHRPLRHSHAHYPDIHHRHRH